MAETTTTCCPEQDDKSRAQISQKIQKAYSTQPELGYKARTFTIELITHSSHQINYNQKQG